MSVPADTMMDVSPEEAAAVAVVQEGIDEQRREIIKKLLAELEEKVHKSVEAKSEVEQRWIEDERQYEGYDRLQPTKDKPFEDDSRTPPRIHATRSKTDLITSRLSDTLLPSHDQPWRLKPEPVPEFAPEDYVNPQTGQRRTDSEMMDLAYARTDRLQKEIQDQLVECKFTASGRRMFRDACRLGTGLLIGPMNKTCIEYRPPLPGAMPVMRFEETTKPEIRVGDPWCFYPEPVESIDRATYGNYLWLMSDPELRKFGLDPRVDQEELAKLLEEKPDLGRVGQAIAQRNLLRKHKEAIDGRWAVWQHVGVLTKEQMDALGCGCDNEESAETGDQEGADEEKVDTSKNAPLPMIEVWFSQGHILMVKLRPIEGDFRLPFYPYSPFPCPNSIFGYSVPYLCRDSDRVAQASWNMTLINGSVSSGALIFMRRAGFTPADGSWEISGPKTIFTDDPDVKMDDAVKAVLIPNNIQMCLQLMDRAYELIDQDINMPQFNTPDVNKPAQTSSGLAMWMNAVTVIQRWAASIFDDEVITPLIERMKWWNWMFNPNPELRVQCDVEALGQSELLVKDLQIQNTQVWMEMVDKGGFAPYVDRYKALQIMSRRMDIPPELLLPKADGDKAAQEQAAQAQKLDDAKAQAEISRAGAEKARAEAEVGRLNLENRQAEALLVKQQNEDQFKIQDRKLDHIEKMAAIQEKHEANQAMLLAKRMELSIEAAKLAQKGNLEIAKINKELRTADMDRALDQYRIAFKGRLDAAKVANQAAEMRLKVSPDNPTHEGI